MAKKKKKAKKTAKKSAKKAAKKATKKKAAKKATKKATKKAAKKTTKKAAPKKKTSTKKLVGAAAVTALAGEAAASQFDREPLGAADLQGEGESGELFDNMAEEEGSNFEDLEEGDYTSTDKDKDDEEEDDDEEGYF